ncbi:Predicted ATPase [Sinosporangium album]|uniref:Predicted ATPase n=1 Tax=Sinosporangium album TaxID=504805 RepID=A0A1G8F792_9ACTN|nr:AAA family ATPase [Sinosporangium album]SDH77967.1 Predicted ATPase [Sinosporangium album]
MLTRIEIDGFKSFADFSLDLPPFLVVLGPNASGKSNLFDAIQLLRRLVDSPTLYEAFVQARGEFGELFRRRGDGQVVDRMSFTVDVLLDPLVVDQFGAEIEVSHTRVRYHLEIVRCRGEDGFVRPFVQREEVIPIKVGHDRWARRHRPSRSFRAEFLKYRRKTALLETMVDASRRPIFRVAQEGRQGRKREFAAHAAEATVLSSITSAGEFPLLYALRREIASWRFLQLDPAALRMPSALHQRGDQLDPSGANLAKVLRRIQKATQDQYGSVLNEISADMARIVRGFGGIEVEENTAKDQYEVYLRTRDEGRVSARVASDGTLRVLALLAALYDPEQRGLICFEEPENGIYPQRLRELVQHLRRLATDPSTEVEPGIPLTQLVMSSHSPLLLFAVPEDIVVMDWITAPEDDSGAASRVSRVRRLGSADSKSSAEKDVVTESERLAYTAISAQEAQRAHGDDLLMTLNSFITAEGCTDYDFLPVLLERALERICVPRGIAVAAVQSLRVTVDKGESKHQAICRTAASAATGMTLLFHHYDGSADVERETRKYWDPLVKERGRMGPQLPLVRVVPVREMESRALADADVLRQVAGSDWNPRDVFDGEKISDAERLKDPKRTLGDVIAKGRRRRRVVREPREYLPLIAETLNLKHLEKLPSYRLWKDETVEALRKLELIRD